jgi:hypothetical protein
LKSDPLDVFARKADNTRMDANTLAKHIVDQATGDEPKKKRQPLMANRGLARKEALTPERRKEIAKKASEARWKKP